MIFKDYYKILGLDTNRVSTVEIKNAYREQAKKYHPDVNVGNKNSEERFKDINEAYRILSETSTKRKYDRIWTRNVVTKRTSYSYNSKNDFLKMFFGEIPENYNLKKENKNPIKGENIEIEIKIKLEEAFNGITKNISIKMPKGELKSFKISIPAGIVQNEKIRIVGQGNPGKNGGKNGDLLVKVNIDSGENFKLEGYDVRKILNISPWEAVFGSKVNFRGINENISVYIPANTNSNDIITISQKGYKDKNGVRGNLILETRILVPNNCTDKEKELFKELKNISKFNPRKV